MAYVGGFALIGALGTVTTLVALFRHRGVGLGLVGSAVLFFSCGVLFLRMRALRRARGPAETWRAVALMLLDAAVLRRRRAAEP